MRLDRRVVLSTAQLAALSLLPLGRRPAYAAEPLRARLSAPLLSAPPVTPDPSDPPLPAWLEGRWEATQTLEQFTTPLGVQFIGAAGRPISEAEASAASTRAQLGRPVKLEVAFGPQHEERAANTAARLNTFAGREVVKRARDCEASDGGLLAGQPAACTLIEYSGPVDQKSLINRVRVEADADGGVAIQEVTRIILARRLMPGDTRNFPPITTDQEVLTSLDAPVGGTARGRLRLVSYLQPLDPLYFAAGGKSVSISDYSLELRRL